MKPVGDRDDKTDANSEMPDPLNLVPLPRLSPAETRRRLLETCERLKIDPDGAEAAELAELLATGADISILDPPE